MYFNILNNDYKMSDDYISDIFCYDSVLDILKNTSEIKHTLKEFLKQNKYVKYADNGEDHIYLYPNNKFFKKYKTTDIQIQFIKSIIIDFIKQLNYEGSDTVIEYTDIYIIDNIEKPIIKVIFI